MADEPRYMAKLTERARTTLHIAEQEAVALRRRTVAAELLLVALLAEERSAAAVAMELDGVEREALRHGLRQMLAESAAGVSIETPARNRRLRRALDAAFEIAKEFGDPYIGTEHLLIGVSRHLSAPGRRLGKSAKLVPESLENSVRSLAANRVEEGTPDRWNELLKAELAEKLKEIDLDHDDDEVGPRTAKTQVGTHIMEQAQWEYRVMPLAGDTPEHVAREAEDILNRQVAFGWQYVDLTIAAIPDGLAGILVLRRAV